MFADAVTINLRCFVSKCIKPGCYRGREESRRPPIPGEPRSSFISKLAHPTCSCRRSEPGRRPCDRVLSYWNSGPGIRCLVARTGAARLICRLRIILPSRRNGSRSRHPDCRDCRRLASPLRSWRCPGTAADESKAVHRAMPVPLSLEDDGALGVFPGRGSRPLLDVADQLLDSVCAVSAPERWGVDGFQRGGPSAAYDAVDLT